MPATLPAPVRLSAAKATLELPFRIPAKEWFSLREVAALSGMSESYVEKKFDEGKSLSGHVHNGGKGARDTKRIPRVWFILWMIETAEYDDASLGDALTSCLKNVSAPILLRIASSCHRFVAEKEKR